MEDKDKVYRIKFWGAENDQIKKIAFDAGFDDGADWMKSVLKQIIRGSYGEKKNETKV